jgi:hypothetical protein
MSCLRLNSVPAKILYLNCLLLPCRTNAPANRFSEVYRLVLLVLLVEELLDKVGLVGAGGVDGRGDGSGAGLLGARSAVHDAADHGREPAHGKVVAADLSASDGVVSNASHCE